MPLLKTICTKSSGLSFDVFVDTNFVEKFCVLGHSLDSDFPEPLQFQCIGQSNKIYSSKMRSEMNEKVKSACGDESVKEELHSTSPSCLTAIKPRARSLP
jgi:hypothetical protein